MNNLRKTSKILIICLSSSQNINKKEENNQKEENINNKNRKCTHAIERRLERFIFA
jgi:hypothetical protein